MINLGIVGTSEGNGHPYSFSAIINGFNKSKFRTSGWENIHNYLSSEPTSPLGITGSRVTHAWTQNWEETKNLVEATNIDVACETLEDMFGHVDALILARDDWESHLKISGPFLEKGIPVFIDKPLTMSQDELSYFLPYIESGKLMTCSGFRFAHEIQDSIELVHSLEKLNLISGVVLNDLERYGIHLLQPVVGLLRTLPKIVTVSRHYAGHESFTFNFDNELIFHLDCVGNVNKMFNLNFYGKNGKFEIDLTNNYRAFRATLIEFLQMIKTGIPPIKASETLIVVGLLQVASKLNQGESRLVRFDDSNYMIGSC